MRLDTLLSTEMIEVGVHVQDWRSAVLATGQLMVRAGAVQDRYAEAMVRVASELGPYIVVAPGVAMPHARPEDGVRRTSVSLVCLANPIEFGNEENDPVETVIGLAAVDHDAHIEIMEQLATLLDMPHVVESIKGAATPEAVRAIISQALGET